MDGENRNADERGRSAKTLTNPNRRGGAADGGADAPALRQALLALDPLCEPPDASGLLPPDDAPPPPDGAERGGGGRTRRGEPGSRPLANRRREQFCRVLTGWGGDGVRKTASEAYSKVYGRSGATARTQGSWLLSIPEVRERAEWLERRVAEAQRHDYLSAQREIDELRLSLVERARHNSKLAAVALAAARDFEAAHGLDGRERGSKVDVTVRDGGASADWRPPPAVAAMTDAELMAAIGVAAAAAPAEGGAR